MLLSLLSKEEKNYFIDLAVELVSIDGQPTEKELGIIKKFKRELGEDVAKYKKSGLSRDKIIDYFVQKTYPTRNLVFLNLVSASLNDDFYSVEEHLFLERIQQAFEISEKKKAELMKCVYSERDLRERVKRIISE